MKTQENKITLKLVGSPSPFDLFNFSVHFHYFLSFFVFSPQFRVSACFLLSSYVKAIASVQIKCSQIVSLLPRPSSLHTYTHHPYLNEPTKDRQSYAQNTCAGPQQTNSCFALQRKITHCSKPNYHQLQIQASEDLTCLFRAHVMVNLQRSCLPLMRRQQKKSSRTHPMPTTCSSSHVNNRSPSHHTGTPL